MGMLLFGIVLISLGSILPHLRDHFDLSELSTGSLVSTLPFGILLGSIVFGPIVDRYGYKVLLLASGVFIFAGLEGIAFTGNLNLLRGSVFLIGIGGGAINGGTNALVADISEGQRGAKLSLLGAFFGIGALLVPTLSASLIKILSYERILMLLGFFVLIPMVFFVTIFFPPPKQPQGFPIRGALKLLKDPLIILIGTVLFFQSGIEGLTNNWTTTFLTEEKDIVGHHALFGLSYFILGMTGMRLILGWALNHIRSNLVLLGSIGFAIIGNLIIFFTESLAVTYLGLVILGAGLAACFPVVLGYTSDKYAHISGTAFSIVLCIALIGNMLSNYGMGIIATAYGTGALPVVLIIGLIIQLGIIVLMFKRILIQ